MSTSPIGKALESLKSKIGDFSSLEVVTFRGDIATYVKPGDGSSNDPLDWDKMMKDAKTSGTMKIALATLVNFDGDVTQFVSDPEPPAWVVDAHKAAVQSSLDARKAIFDLFADTVKEALAK